jgi:hypothetical protein
MIRLAGSVVLTLAVVGRLAAVAWARAVAVASALRDCLTRACSSTGTGRRPGIFTPRAGVT